MTRLALIDRLGNPIADKAPIAHVEVTATTPWTFEDLMRNAQREAEKLSSPKRT
jgi:hypothetical protein